MSIRAWVRRNAGRVSPWHRTREVADTAAEWRQLGAYARLLHCPARRDALTPDEVGEALRRMADHDGWELTRR